MSAVRGASSPTRLPWTPLSTEPVSEYYHNLYGTEHEIIGNNVIKCSEMLIIKSRCMWGDVGYINRVCWVPHIRSRLGGAADMTLDIQAGGRRFKSHQAPIPGEHEIT